MKKNAGAASLVEGDWRTRERVARLILQLGPSTAVALSVRLGLTPAAIRKHLDVMLADGTLVAREAPVRGPRGRGRPARLFALSDAGHARKGANAYDAVAVDALRFLRETAGEQAVEEFAHKRMAEWESRYEAQISMAMPRRCMTAAAAYRSASTTARCSTWRRSSRRCARQKQKRSVVWSGGTCSGSRRSRTVTEFVRRTSR